MKILVKTTQNGKIEIQNRETGEILTNIGRVDIYVDTHKNVSVFVEFKDVEAEIEDEINDNG